MKLIHKYFISCNLHRFIPHIALTLIIFIFSYKTLIARDFGGDFIAYFLPHYRFILNEIKSNGLPFWYPYAYNGLPELFKSELAIFHPITLIVLLSDLLINRGNSLNITGNLFEAGWFLFLCFGTIGAYEFIRQVYISNRLAAFIGALAFALNPLMLPTMNTNVFLGVSALPWALLSAYKLTETFNIRNSIFLILSNYLIFSAGYPYFYVYFLIAQLGLVSFYGYRKILRFGVVYTIATLLCASFLLPNLHIYSQSVRDNSRDSSDLQLFTSNIPTRLINILNPMPFGQSYSEIDPASVFTSNGVSWGTTLLLFLVIGIFSIRNEKKYFWLIATFLIAFVYSFGGYFYAAQFFSTFIPVIEKFRSHSISLVLTMLCGSVFISLGIERVVSGFRSENIEKIFGLLFVLLFVALTLIPVLCPQCSNQNLPQILSLSRTIFFLFVSISIYSLIVKFKSTILLYLLILFSLIEFHFYFQNLNGHFLDTKYGNFYRENKLLPDFDKDNGEHYRVYFDNNQFSYNTGMHKVFSYAGYETVPYKGWYSLQNKYGFNKSLRLSNVKYMVTTNPNWNAQNVDALVVENTSPAERPHETYISTVPGLPFLSSKSSNTHYIYEISKYQGRIFLPEKIYGCGKSCQIKENLPQTVVLKDEESLNFLENPNPANVNYEITSYRPNRVSIKASTASSTFFVMSETWDKGWSLKVNGVPKKIYKVGDVFRGVYLEPGDNIEIVMEYFPPYLLLGAGISLFGLILLIAMILKQKVFVRIL